MEIAIQDEGDGVSKIVYLDKFNVAAVVYVRNGKFHHTSVPAVSINHGYNSPWALKWFLDGVEYDSELAHTCAIHDYYARNHWRNSGRVILRGIIAMFAAFGASVFLAVILQAIIRGGH